MKYILIIILTALCITSYGQSAGQRIPNSNGITHHTIEENKIQMMKNANLARRQVVQYKRKVTIGYVETGVGISLMLVAGCFMDVPQKWSDGRYNSRYNRRRLSRHIVAGVGALIAIDGVIRIGKNHKKLNKIQYRLSPTSGGVKFYF